jgi:hypothetical protein
MAATITVGTNSWITLVEANALADARLGAALWDAATDDNKNRALIQAYSQLISHVDFSIPAASSDDAVKQAQFEQALFLTNNVTGADQRAALQAMGVVKAGVVQETYTAGGGSGPAISPDARALLSDLDTPNVAWATTTRLRTTQT